MGIFMLTTNELMSPYDPKNGTQQKIYDKVTNKTPNIHPAKSLKDTPYEFKYMTYPNDLLGSSKYGGNYMVFYINVLTQSYLLKSETHYEHGTVEKSYVPSSDSKRGAVLGLTADQLSTGAITQGVSFGGVASVLTGGVKKVATAGAAAAAAVMAATSGGTNTREITRLKDAIALYIPNSLSVRYTSTWDDTDINQLFMAGANLGSGWDALVKAFDEGKVGESMTAGGEVLTAALVLNTPGLGDNISINTGRAKNPFKENLYKGVPFRTFQFDYDFLPRNSAEKDSVNEIIKMFKLHMHPENSPTGFMYLYPSEFDIEYYTKDKENLNLHRHTSCVLTNLSVNYTPDSQFVTFEDGAVAHIKMTLEFKELAILTKELIQDNY